MKHFTTDKLLILTFMLLALCPNLIEIHAQSKALKKTVKQFQTIQKNTPQEKLYLHTDRSVYVSGDRVWFQAYLVTANMHQLIGLNTVAYVEFIDAQKKILLKRYIKIQNGVGSGDFKIPYRQAKGNYVIRAYTRYMQNFDAGFFFHKKIKVLDINTLNSEKKQKRIARKTRKALKKQRNNPGLDVQFFPEGGDMINQLANHVAFKASDRNGKGATIKGKLVDDQGKKLLQFSSKKFGLGKFMLIPQPEKQYTAIVQYQNKEYRFVLPQSKPNGFKMQVSSNAEYIQVMTSSKNQSVKNTSIIAHTRGIVITQYTFKKVKQGFVLRIPKKGLPSGIVHLTLFDAQQRPQCERLVFVENPADLKQIKISSKKTDYKHRAKATFDFQLAQTDTLVSNVSVAVVNASLETPQSQKMNIQNYLWLRADLKGYIENPAYYFNTKNKDRLQMLDLLLMTQGWRRFNWIDIQNSASKKLAYNRETGFTISGYLSKFDNYNKPITGKVQFYPLENLTASREIHTNKKGRFVFRNIQVEDTVTLVVQGTRLIEKKRRGKRKARIKERTRNIFLHLDSVNAVTNSIPDAYLQTSDPTIVQEQKNLKRTYQINQINAIKGLEPDVVQLDEVKIVASRRRTKLYSQSSLNVDFTKQDLGTLSGLSFFDALARRISMVVVVGVFPNQTAYIRNRSNFPINSGIAETKIVKEDDGEPLFLLDGVRVQPEVLSSLNIHDVAFVDVLTTSRAAIYGADARNGVIAVYSRDGREKMRPRVTNGRIAHLKHPGYYKARTFYVPKYDTQKIAKDQLDYRRILYWNPSVKLDKNGKAKISFFTSDETANYRIEVEGITPRGKVILGTYNFEVK